MRFRPADASAGPNKCPHCGKVIQAMGGMVLKNCPFCKGDLTAAAPGAPASARCSGCSWCPRGSRCPQGSWHVRSHSFRNVIVVVRFFKDWSRKLLDQSFYSLKCPLRYNELHEQCKFSNAEIISGIKEELCRLKTEFARTMGKSRSWF